MNSLRELEPWLYAWARYLVQLAAPYGAVVTSVRRSAAQQARLYHNFVVGASRYPAAPPGRSMHQVGRAFDLAASPWLLAELGQLWESWGGRWGGRAGDPIHFEG